MKIKGKLPLAKTYYDLQEHDTTIAEAEKATGAAASDYKSAMNLDPKNKNAREALKKPVKN